MQLEGANGGSQQALVDSSAQIRSPHHPPVYHLSAHKRTLIVFCVAAAVLAFQVALVLMLFHPTKVTPGEVISLKNRPERRRLAVDDYADGEDDHGLDEGPPATGGASSGRQLWCVFEPGRGGYSLSDVPVPLCTVVLYCCVHLTARGVRYRRAEDEGPDGVDAFASLRRRRLSLPLYALLGDGVQTTAVFCNQVRGSTPNELSALAGAWLHSKQLDGLLFFYRSHRTSTATDAEFFAHMGRIRDDLGRMGLFVSAVVSFHREQPDGPLSPSSVLSLVQDIVVLRTHDLSPAPAGAAACPMPFALGGATRAPSVSRLLKDLRETLPGFERSMAPRLLFSITFEAASYFLNRSGFFHEGDPAVKMATGSNYWQMCEMAAKMGYNRHYSRHGDCQVVHKDRFWQAGFGPNSSLLFGSTRHFAGVVLFAMHADDARGRCGEPHGLANHVRRSLDRFAAPSTAAQNG